MVFWRHLAGGKVASWLEVGGEGGELVVWRHLACGKASCW